MNIGSRFRNLPRKFTRAKSSSQKSEDGSAAWARREKAQRGKTMTIFNDILDEVIAIRRALTGSDPGSASYISGRELGLV
jgi:hypothetical protein